MEKAAIFGAQGDMVIMIGKVEVVNIGDEPWIIKAEEDCVDEVTGSVISFKNVDLVVVDIRGVVWKCRGCL